MHLTVLFETSNSVQSVFPGRSLLGYRGNRRTDIQSTDSYCFGQFSQEILLLPFDSYEKNYGYLDETTEGAQKIIQLLSSRKDLARFNIVNHQDITVGEHIICRCESA